MNTGAQNTQTTPAYYEPDAVSDDPEQHKLRVLIDEAATLRGLTIQMSLRLMALAAAPTDEDRLEVRNEFRTLQAQFAENMEMLFGKSTPKAANKAHVEWIRKTAGINVERRAELLKVDADIQRVMHSLDAGQIPSFVEAREFFDKNWHIVRDKMTEVIWDLWADLDKSKSDTLDKNTALQETLQSTLKEIKKFSIAIRMIAINTAVLAARPLDAGAGFQAISQDVKLLSEGIDASVKRAQETIAGLI